MKKDFIHTIKIVIAAFIITLGLNYLYAWTGPTATPPNGNATAPLNTSPIGQQKDGQLLLNGLDSDNNPASYALTTVNGMVNFGVDGSGKVTATSTGLKLAVQGKVGATNYCAITGLNCFTTSQLNSTTTLTVPGNVYVQNKICDTAGANCSTLNQITNNITTTNALATSSRTVYFSDYNVMLQSLKSSQSCINTGTQSSSGVQQSWTLNELKALYPQIASEKNNIKSIILSYNTNITNSSANNYSKNISILHYNDTSGLGTLSTAQKDFLSSYQSIINVVLHTTNGVTNAGETKILDLNGDSTFTVWSFASLAQGTAQTSAICMFNKFYVIGYITQ